MKHSERVTLLITVMLMMSVLSGCLFPKGPVEVILPPKNENIQHNEQTDSEMAARFQDSNEIKSRAAVDSAVELSEKYAKLAEEMVELRQKNKDLTTENAALSNELVGSQEKLKQTEKELDDATDLLVDMQIELNTWKSDILGFRNEMRSAEKAQLDALLQILTALGGEINVDANSTDDDQSLALKMAEQSQANSVLGGSNE